MTHVYFPVNPTFNPQSSTTSLYSVDQVLPRGPVSTVVSTHTVPALPEPRSAAATHVSQHVTQLLLLLFHQHQSHLQVFCLQQTILVQLPPVAHVQVHVWNQQVNVFWVGQLAATQPSSMAHVIPQEDRL